MRLQRAVPMLATVAALTAGVTPANAFDNRVKLKLSRLGRRPERRGGPSG